MERRDEQRGRQVWHRAAETEMKSDRHFWASLNYVLHNAVRHGYVEHWQDWPHSNADRYLSEVGPDDKQNVAGRSIQSSTTGKTGTHRSSESGSRGAWSPAFRRWTFPNPAKAGTPARGFQPLECRPQGETETSRETVSFTRQGAKRGGGLFHRQDFPHQPQVIGGAAGHFGA